jgi:hypothetical protein
MTRLYMKLSETLCIGYNSIWGILSQHYSRISVESVATNISSAFPQSKFNHIFHEDYAFAQILS